MDMPHSFTIYGDRWKKIEQWCRKTWPRTYGATWKCTYVGLTILPVEKRTSFKFEEETWIFSFVRPEDYFQFTLTWGVD
jgi:hypothetical protein